VATKLIELEDGILCEIDIPGEQIEQIPGGMANKISSSLSKIKPVLLNVCSSITAGWKELSQDVYIEKAEIELGLSFEGEGNVYITKSKVGANLTIKLFLQPNVK
jgi:hypothetical protein